MPRIRILPIVFMYRVSPCCALFLEIKPDPFDFEGDFLALQGSIFSGKGARSKPGTIQVRSEWPLRLSNE